jgi:hypothetical protein
MIDGGLSQIELDVLRAADGDRMSPQSRSAILGALGVALPPAIPGAPDVSSLAGASQGATAGAAGALSGAAGKALLGILGVGIVGGASLWGYLELADQATRTPAAATLPTTAEVAEVAPPAVSAAPEPGAFEAEPGVVNITPAETATRRAEPKRSVAAQSDSLPQEFALIEAAQAALKRNDGRATLRHLEEYRKQFPQGQLRAEARVLRVEGLAATGQRTEAIRLGEATLKASPTGPYAGRLRSLLDELGAKPEARP